MITLPVKTAKEALERFGSIVGAPDIGGFFIDIEQQSTIEVDTAHDYSTKLRSGKPTITLLRRVEASGDNSDKINAEPIAEFWPDYIEPKRANLGEKILLPLSYFDDSPISKAAFFDNMLSTPEDAPVSQDAHYSHE